MISGHEAGAIEAGGHKVLELPHHNGKLAAEDIKECIKRYQEDDNRDHTVMPGMDSGKSRMINTRFYV